MKIEGSIEDIVFVNADNGFSIIVLDVGGEPVTAVGSFPPLSEGERLRLEGDYVIHPKFGRQFKTTAAVRLKPDTADGVVRYLGSGLIKGVGPKTALSIVAKFGAEALDVIETRPEALTKLRGVSPAKAKQIHDAYMENKLVQDAVIFLQEYGISVNLALKIFKIYEAKTVEKVKDNPYRLIEDVDGVGFVTADRIAAAMGIAPDSDFRVRAAVVYVLKDSGERGGNTYLPLETLQEEVERLIGAGKEQTAAAAQELLLEQKLKKIAVEQREAIFFRPTFQVEKSVADYLLRLLSEADRLPCDCRGDIDAYQKTYAISFHSDQVKAVECAVKAGVSVITGGPGTGKTTILKCVLDIMDRLGRRVMLMAPTGRAAKRMSDSTGKEASTIHRALMRASDGDSALNADTVIVDEVSMVDIYLMHMLLRRLNKGTRLILVGDKDQLPSVGAGNVLGDILASGIVPTVSLSYVYRQEEASLIIENAHAINEGRMPRLKDTGRDFFFSRCETPEQIAATVVDMAARRLPAYLDLEPQRVQVLCPLKNGPAGTVNLNRLLQQRLNGAQDEELAFEETPIKKGDKVMHISNDYRLKWTRYSPYFEQGEGVFNGDMGIVTEIDVRSFELRVLFEDGRSAVYTRAELPELMLSYAITVHKSQGCEFDAVLLPVMPGSPQILTRNLLYTAITRAKRAVVLVGTEYAVKRMVENDYVAARYSGLKTFLLDTYNDMKALYGASFLDN